MYLTFTFTCRVSLPVRALSGDDKLLVVTCSGEDEQCGGIPGINNRRLQFLGLLNCAHHACERPNLPAVQVSRVIVNQLALTHLCATLTASSALLHWVT